MTAQSDTKDIWSAGRPAIAVSSETYPPLGYALFVLTLFFLTAVLSYTDRLVLNLLVDPIRSELDISDTGISLLQGAAFAVLYAVFGLPLGRYADSHNRRNLVLAGVAVWSLCTALCAFAASFTELFIARIGVGLGEAALAPAAISIISDYFPPHRRARAIGFFLAGMVAGAGAANIVAGLLLGAFQSGWLNEAPVLGELAPWRATLLVLALPGIPLIALLFFVQEPQRRERIGAASTVSLGRCVSYLKANARTFGLAFGGLALLQFVDYGINAWLPTLLMRGFAVAAAEAGTSLGTIAIAGSLLGAFLGGYAADKLQLRGHVDAKLRLATAGAVVLLPLLAFPTLGGSLAVLAGFAVYTLIFAALGAAGIAAMQDIAPSEMRGLVVALQAFLYTLLGLGVGPTAVAFVSDTMAPDGGSIGSAMALVTLPATVLAVWLLWQALPAYRQTRISLLDRATEVEKRKN